MSSEKPPHIKQVEQVASIGLTATAGACAGAVVTNELVPPTIHPVPGVEFTAQLSLHQGLTVNAGPWGLHAPHALGNNILGIQANITRLDLKLTGHHSTFESLAALVSHFHADVADPTKAALLERLLYGAGISGLVGGIVGYKSLRALQNKGLRERLRGVTERIANLSERINNMSRKAKAGILISTLGVTGCGANLYSDAFTDDVTPHGILPAAITAGNPSLRGAYVTGVDPSIPANAVNDLTTYKRNADHFWGPQEAIGNFNRAFRYAKATSMSKYFNNRNLIRLQQQADMHCNNPAYPYIENELKQTDPQVIVEDGDLQTNSGTMPYEKNCISGFVKAVDGAAIANGGLMYVVRVNAEHDAKQSLDLKRPHVVIRTLRGDNNIAEFDHLTFVGEDDPRQVVWTTVPSDRATSNKVLALEGSSIASTACKITETTGQAPYVVSSDEMASVEALQKGCATIAFNGHTHLNGPINVIYSQDGVKEYRHTVGTATGVDEGITVYQTPSRDATSTTWFINKATHLPVAAFTEVLHTDGSVNIERQPVNGSPVQLPVWMSNVISQDSPTFNK